MTPAAAPISQGGQASLSRKSHYLESAGAEPAPATKGVRALKIHGTVSVGVSDQSKMPDSVNTDFVSLNYHRRVLKLALQWIYLGMWQERAANALPKKAK